MQNYFLHKSPTCTTGTTMQNKTTQLQIGCRAHETEKVTYRQVLSISDQSGR